MSFIIAPSKNFGSFAFSFLPFTTISVPNFSPSLPMVELGFEVIAFIVYFSLLLFLIYSANS